MRHLVSGTMEYLDWTLDNPTLDGEAYDPTGDEVDFAFIPSGTDPASSDWRPGIVYHVDGEADTLYHCKIMYGTPTTTLDPGLYNVLWRILVDTQEPIRVIGQVYVT